MVRILLVQETDWKDKGPHQQHHLLERIVRRGHEALIIDYDVDWSKKNTRTVTTPRLEIDVESKTISGVKTQLIRPSMLRVPVLCYLSVIIFHSIEILRQVRKFKPNVILGMGLLNTFVANAVARLFKIPFIYYWIDSYHNLIPEKSFRRIGRLIESRILRTSDCVMAINDQLAIYQISLGAAGNRVSVIPAGVAKDWFNPDVKGTHIRSKLGIDPDESLLLFMGWMYEFSGLREVVSDIIDLDTSTRIRLLIVGKGELKEELQELGRKPESRGRVIILDWVPYKELPQYIAASDICILPAFLNDVMRHIVPIKLYEYMACGKPVVATQLPGVMREFRAGNGIVYAHSPNDVVSTVLNLIRNEELEVMGQNAASFALKRDWEKIVDAFCRTITRATKARIGGIDPN